MNRSTPNSKDQLRFCGCLRDYDHKLMTSVDRVNITAEDNITLTNKHVGNMFTFQQVFGTGSSNYEIYHSSIEPLLSLFLTGWNTCFIMTGCKGSGKAQTVAGNKTTNVGIFNIVLEQIFLKLSQNTVTFMADSIVESGQNSSEANRSDLPHMSMLAFDVDGENIIDLLALEQADNSLQPKLHESAENGVSVQNLTSRRVDDSKEGQSLFHQAWSNHSSTCNLFIKLELNTIIANTATTARSNFTFVVIPMSIPVGQTREVFPSSSRAKETSLSSESQTYVNLTQLVAALANQPYAERIVNYSGCLVTKLLQEILGGNCLTRLLMCFSPFEDPQTVTAMFELAYFFSQVKNFPIINEVLSQQLLTQYRARLINLQQRIDSHSTGVHIPTDFTQIDRLESENMKLLESNRRLVNRIDEIDRIRNESRRLHESNERLVNRIDELQKKYDKLAVSRTDLNAQLLKSDEKKLELSKSLVDMQIENNRLKEDASATKFDLTSKIRQLEVAVAEADDSKKMLKQISDSAEVKLQEADRRYQALAEEFAQLQSHKILLSAAYDKQTDRNDQLSIELLKMVNSQLSAMEQSDAAEKERENIRSLINHLAIRPEAVQRFDEVRTSVEKPVFEAMNKLQVRLDQERIEFEEERSQFNSKISSLRAELTEARRQTRGTQSRCSELNAQLIRAFNDKASLESQVNKLQHKMKDVTRDYRSKLDKCIKDIAAYMDQKEHKLVNDVSATTPANMQQYVDEMLDDMKRAHRIREDQLSSAAITYKRRLEQVVRQQEVLLVAYSDLRQQVEARGLTEVELGPDEHQLVLHGEPELKSSQQRHIEKLQNDLIQKQTELNAAKLRLRIGEANKEDRDQLVSDENVVKHSKNAQERWENERARLLSDNAMLKEQVAELQDYIDSQLDRFRDETVRLRQVISQFKLTNLRVSDNGRSPTSLQRRTSAAMPSNSKLRRSEEQRWNIFLDDCEV